MALLPVPQASEGEDPVTPPNRVSDDVTNPMEPFTTGSTHQPVAKASKLDRVLHWLFSDKWRLLALSALSVTCWSLVGNLCRLTLHTALVKANPAFGTSYVYIGPNSLGSMMMGFALLTIPAAKLPLVAAAILFGFCGSFTTFSSWVVAIVNSTGSSAFLSFLSGITIPFIFFIWGRDLAIGLEWLIGRLVALRQARRGRRASEPREPVHADAKGNGSEQQTAGEWPGNEENKTSHPSEKAGRGGRSGGAESRLGRAESGDGSVAPVILLSEDMEESTVLKEEPLLSPSQRRYHLIDLTFLIVSFVAAVVVLVIVGVVVVAGDSCCANVHASDLRAVAFAPLGAVPRFLLAFFFNNKDRFRKFPVGTVTANTIAVILAVVMDNYANQAANRNQWYAVVLQGLCGALSTGATFVKDTVMLYIVKKKAMSYGYVLLTLTVGFTIGFIGARRNF